MEVERLTRALQDEWRATTEPEPELAARFGLETAEIDGVFASRCGPGGGGCELGERVEDTARCEALEESGLTGSYRS